MTAPWPDCATDIDHSIPSTRIAAIRHAVQTSTKPSNTNLRNEPRRARRRSASKLTCRLVRTHDAAPQKVSQIIVNRLSSAVHGIGVTNTRRLAICNTTNATRANISVRRSPSSAVLHQLHTLRRTRRVCVSTCLCCICISWRPQFLVLGRTSPTASVMPTPPTPMTSPHETYRDHYQ